MDAGTFELIHALHASQYRYVLAITGGGAPAAGMLLSVPGASKTLLESIVPYHNQALISFLGHEPDQFCSMATGQAMAQSAYERALALAPGQEVLGLGCTASLASDRPKRGQHRFYVSTCTAEELRSWSLVLAKDQRDRPGEEAIVAGVILNALAEVAGVEERVELGLLKGEALDKEIKPSGSALARFYRKELEVVGVTLDGQIRSDLERPRLLVPGSFCPLHRGHLSMAEAAESLTGKTAAFEISALNVDKGFIPQNEIRRRLTQFQWHAPIWLTRCPTFSDKSQLFPGATFVIGIDTAERLLMPRYYKDSEELMMEAFAEIRSSGCGFLVAGRCDDQGRFRALDDLTIPSSLADLFEPIPETIHRVDLSSTQIRSSS